MGNTPYERLQKIRAVVFDFDGVLAEPMNGDPVLYALRNGRAHTAPPHMGRLFEIAKQTTNGSSLISMIEEAGMDVSDKKLIREISAYIASSTCNDYIAFSWVGALLKALAQRTTLALCSNNTVRTIGHVLGDLLDHFESIRTFEDVTRLKPHPEGLRSISEELCLEPSALLLVGDTMEDMVSALTAGTHFALATWGTKQVLWMKQFLSSTHVGCCDEITVFQLNDPRKLLGITS